MRFLLCQRFSESPNFCRQEFKPPTWVILRTWRQINIQFLSQSSEDISMSVFEIWYLWSSYRRIFWDAYLSCCFEWYSNYTGVIGIVSQKFNHFWNTYLSADLHYGVPPYFIWINVFESKLYLIKWVVYESWSFINFELNNFLTV